MKYTARNAKRDGNEADIVKILRRMGLRVDTFNRPWDLVVTGPLGLISRHAEVKAIKNKIDIKPADFTADQKEVLKSWPGGKIDVLWTDESAIQFAKRLMDHERLLLLKINETYDNEGKRDGQSAYSNPSLP